MFLLANGVVICGGGLALVTPAHEELAVTDTGEATVCNGEDVAVTETADLL